MLNKEAARIEEENIKLQVRDRPSTKGARK